MFKTDTIKRTYGNINNNTGKLYFFPENVLSNYSTGRFLFFFGKSLLIVAKLINTREGHVRKLGFVIISDVCFRLIDPSPPFV